MVEPRLETLPQLRHTSFLRLLWILFLDSGAPLLYSLFVTCGKDYGKSFVVTDSMVTIGRDQKNSVLLKDEEVSRIHCSLLAESSQVFLIDEGSSNGTFLNGLAITRAQVHKGDKIRIGNTQLEFNSVLQISLGHKDLSPLTASPTRVNKNSPGRENSGQSKADTGPIDLESADVQNSQISSSNSQISSFTEHRINNLLQGLTGGAHLVQSGLDSKNLDLSQTGWAIVKANHNRVTE